MAGRLFQRGKTAEKNIRSRASGPGPDGMSGQGAVQSISERKYAAIRVSPLNSG